MKHVFTVHSPITFLCAYGITQQEQLPLEDVIFIVSKYKLPFSFGKVFPSFQETQDSVWKKLVNWNVPKAHDAYISCITDGEPFIAYIDLMHAYQRILVTHTKCESFNFFEEGTASYSLGKRLEDLTHIAANFEFRNNHFLAFINSLMRVLRGHTLRLLSLPYYPRAYAYLENVSYYTVSIDCFPGVDDQKKKILNLQEYDEALKLMSLGVKLKSAIIWIEESYFNVYKVSNETYEKVVEISFEKLIKEYPNHEHYVKLRPQQAMESSTLMKTLRQVRDKVKILEPNILIEPLLIRSEDCIVVGCVSSVLFYGSIYGHTSLSFYNLITNKPKSIFDDLDIYWEMVKSIT